MSTVPATEKEFGSAPHTDPDTTKEAAASIHVVGREQDVQICGDKRSPLEPKCHGYRLVL